MQGRRNDAGPVAQAHSRRRNAPAAVSRLAPTLKTPRRMKPPQVLGPGAQVAIAAIVLLRMVGGALIVAHSGFATSPGRGGPSVVVPVPAAYMMGRLSPMAVSSLSNPANVAH